MVKKPTCNILYLFYLIHNYIVDVKLPLLAHDHAVELVSSYKVWSLKIHVDNL